MAGYGHAFRDRGVAQLLPPESASVEAVSREVRVGSSTLERWRAAAAALAAPEEARASPRQTREAQRRLKALGPALTVRSSGTYHDIGYARMFENGRELTQTTGRSRPTNLRPRSAPPSPGRRSPRGPGSGPCSPAWYGPVGAGPPAGSWSCGRSGSPWSWAPSAPHTRGGSRPIRAADPLTIRATATWRGAQILKISSAYTPPPSEGFVSPMTWGIESHAVERFAGAGARAEAISVERSTFTFDFPSAPSGLVAAFNWDTWRSRCGCARRPLPGANSHRSTRKAHQGSVGRHGHWRLQCRRCSP